MMGERIGFITIVLIPLIISVVAIILAFVVNYVQKRIRTRREIYAAGARGEEIATDMIRAVMRDGDYLLTNVVVQFGHMTAEIDNIIVNRYGVFAIEVKNYHGELRGGEDDRSWEKTKTTKRGNQYVNTVRNPIRQVKRGAFVLRNYIKEQGVNVWVDEYVILTEFNSPVESAYILADYDDIDNAIHRDIKRLTKSKVRRVMKMFSHEAIEEIAS